MLGCAQTDEGNRAHNADLMQHGQKNSGSQIEIFSLLRWGGQPPFAQGEVSRRFQCLWVIPASTQNDSTAFPDSANDEWRTTPRTCDVRFPVPVMSGFRCRALRRPPCNVGFGPEGDENSSIPIVATRSVMLTDRTDRYEARPRWSSRTSTGPDEGCSILGKRS